MLFNKEDEELRLLICSYQRPSFDEVVALAKARDVQSVAELWALHDLLIAAWSERKSTEGDYI